MTDWMNGITYDMLQGKQREIADIIGVEATLKLCEYIQGNDFYIPKNDRAYAKLRNMQMRREYIDGNWTIAALAKRYKLTPSSVRKIVKDVRPNQIGIDDL